MSQKRKRKWKRNGIKSVKKRRINGARNGSSLPLMFPNKLTFEWMFGNNNDVISSFLKEYWHVKPYLLIRNDKNYYKNVGINLTFNDICTIISKKQVKYGENIIIKKFDKKSMKEENFTKMNEVINVNELKVLFNNNKATLQFLHPQFYHFEIGNLIYNMESYFGDIVSSNVYVTPKYKQGLMIHWDNIEAFILQLSGKKKWYLYELIDDKYRYPIFESTNLTLDIVKKYCKLVKECVVNEGDLLYFPRGCIHYAECLDVDSIHLTVSTGQYNTYGDMIKKVINNICDSVISNNVELRKNIPINVINGQNCKEMNGKLNEFVKDICQSLKDKSVIDGGIANVVKQMGVEYVSKRYPPTQFIEPNEYVIYGRNENKKYKDKIEQKMVKKDELIDFIENNDKRDDIINMNQMVKITNIDWIRVVKVKDMVSPLKINLNDDNTNVNDIKNGLNLDEQNRNNVLLYRCIKNDYNKHSMALNDYNGSQPLMTDGNNIHVFNALMNTYPEWISVKNLVDTSQCDKDLCFDLLFSLWAEDLIEIKR